LPVGYTQRRTLKVRKENNEKRSPNKFINQFLKQSAIYTKQLKTKSTGTVHTSAKARLTNFQCRDTDPGPYLDPDP